MVIVVEEIMGVVVGRQMGWMGTWDKGYGSGVHGCYGGGGYGCYGCYGGYGGYGEDKRNTGDRRNEGNK